MSTRAMISTSMHVEAGSEITPFRKIPPATGSTPGSGRTWTLNSKVRPDTGLSAGFQLRHFLAECCCLVLMISVGFIVELLEQPTAMGDIEAVKKAKMLYRSCMNESEFHS